MSGIVWSKIPWSWRETGKQERCNATRQLAASRGRELPEKAVAVTFDTKLGHDGGRETRCFVSDFRSAISATRAASTFSVA